MQSIFLFKAMYFLKFSFTKQITISFTTVPAQWACLSRSCWWVWQSRAGDRPAEPHTFLSAGAGGGGRRSPRGRTGHIPRRVVQKGMKRARSPAGGAGEDAGPCRAGEIAQGCRVATATGALFVHSGSSCLPPSLPPSRPAAPSPRGCRGHRRLRGSGPGDQTVRTGLVLAEIKRHRKKKAAI